MTLVVAALTDELLTRGAFALSRGLIYGLLALGIVLIYKGSRIINFAHPFFGLLAAFLAWWINAKASFPPFSWIPFDLGTRPRFVIAAFLALAIVGLNGLAVEHGVIRRLRGAPRLAVLVATIAVAQGTAGTVLLLFNRNEEQANTSRRFFADGGKFLDFTVSVGNTVISGAEVLVFIVGPLICLGAAAFFRYTRFGVAVRAAAENRDAARLLGIPAERVSQFVWGTGIVLAGVAGILITDVRGSLDIGTLSTGFLVRGLAAALIGGLASLPGAIVGGLLLGTGETLLKWWTNDQPGVPETLMFGAVILILVVRPGGLFGQREDTEDRAAFVPTIRELPARLRGTTAANGVRYIGYAFCLFLLPISLVTGTGTNGVLVRVAVFAMIGVSLTILMGFTGQISLGHYGLAGVGAFAMANFVSDDRMGLPYLVGLPLTVLVGMVVSLVIGLPALRIKGLYLAIITLAFNLAAEFYIFGSRLVGGSTAGIRIDPPKLGPLDLDSTSNRPMFVFAAFWLVVTLVIARNLARSRTGRGFFALRENEKAAATLGVELTRYKLLAFAVSGGVAALAGAVFLTYLNQAEPTAWRTEVSLLLVAMVMIGGLGSLMGSVFGAFVLFGLPDLLEFLNDWVVAIGTGVLLIIVIVRAPGGLAGVVLGIRDRLVNALDEMSRQPTAAAPPPSPAPTSD